MLQNLCFIFQKMPFISYFYSFKCKECIFHKPCAKTYIPTLNTIQVNISVSVSHFTALIYLYLTVYGSAHYASKEYMHKQ